MCEESLLFFSSFGIHHRNRIKFKFGHCPENAARVSSINDQSDLTERLWRFINLGSKCTRRSNRKSVCLFGKFTDKKPVGTIRATHQVKVRRLVITIITRCIIKLIGACYFFFQINLQPVGSRYTDTPCCMEESTGIAIQ